MNDKNDIVDSINFVSEEETQTESQRVYTLFYTFFLIPLMIVVFGALFFGLFYTITEEPTDVNQLLNKLETGSQRDKGDASIQLNQLFYNDPSTYDPIYRPRIIDIHESTKEDKYADEELRIYTIQIMGNSGDKGFGEVLIKELSSDKSEFRIKAIESLGKLQYKPAALEITPFLKKDKPFLEKLAAAGALGNIGNKDAIEPLVALIESWPKDWLVSDGPELRWDAALSLLKLEYSDATTESIINNLLDREYLKTIKVTKGSEN